jgi:hypothetical protein
MDRDDLWIVEHFSELVAKYAGKYVAVVNEKLVGRCRGLPSGRGNQGTRSRTREIPSVLRVPREEDMVCLLSSSHTRFTKVT